MARGEGRAAEYVFRGASRTPYETLRPQLHWLSVLE
jgi:hypothetical protein